MPLRKSHILAGALAATASFGAAFASAANAADTTTAAAGTGTVVTTTSDTGDTLSPAVPAGTCTPLPTTKAFSKVDGDAADYSAAPDGTFEGGGKGWTFTGGAKIATANENLGIASGTKALQMPLVSSATSPNFCVDESHPSFRFAFKIDNSVLAGFMAYVIYRDAKGAITNVELLSSKLVALTPSKWQASPKSPLASIVPLNNSSKSASVQLKITCLSPTNIVDDLTGGAFTPITSFVGAAGGLVGSVTGLLGNSTNIGVSVDSVMVDPYRRG